MMGCGLKKVGNLLAELDSRKGIGLITRIRQGLGRPDRIYVRKCTQQDMYKRNIQTRQNKVINIRQYLLTVLYNAPLTISNYYSALVQHDMYGDSEE